MHWIPTSQKLKFTLCLLSALVINSGGILAGSVTEDFDYPAGPLDESSVTGPGQAGYWQQAPDRRGAATLPVVELEWSPASGAPVPTTAKAAGGKTGISGAFEMEAPVDFDQDGEVWFRFLYRRPAEPAGSVGNLSFSSDQEELARVWQTVGGGGVSAGMGANLQASGDEFPGIDTDLLVIGRIQTRTMEPDVMEIQITRGNQTLPETFTPQIHIAEEVFGQAHWVHFWNFEAPVATGAYFGGFRMGDSREAVLEP